MTAAKLDSNQRAALLTVGRLMRAHQVEIRMGATRFRCQSGNAPAHWGIDLLDAFERAIGDECSLDAVGLLMGGKGKGE